MTHIISKSFHLNMISTSQILILACMLAISVKGEGPGRMYLPPGGGGEGGKPEPFSFSYEVKDAASGNDYSHMANSDGKRVMGEYMVLLPDTRRQKVKYMADDNGYVADVQYEGEAVYGGPGGGNGGGYPSGGSSGGYPSGKPGGSYLPPRK